MSLQSYADVAGGHATPRRSRSGCAAPPRRRSPRFDSGYWTYYALPGDWSPLDYQQYVVQLLKRLAPTDARFASAATRFAAYAKQPPAFKVDDRRPRLAALLALEAGDRDGDDRRRARPSASRSRAAGTRSAGRSRSAQASTRCTSAPSTGRATAPRSTRCRSCASPRRLRSRSAARRTAAARAAGPPPLAVGAGIADPSAGVGRCSQRACGSFASASRGRPEPPRRIRGSSPRCNACRRGSGSSSTCTPCRWTTQDGLRSRSTAHRSSSRCRRSATSCSRRHRPSRRRRPTLSTLAALRNAVVPTGHPGRRRPARSTAHGAEGRAGRDRPGARRSGRGGGRRRLQARAGGRQEPLDDRERAAVDGRRRAGASATPHPSLVDGVVATPTAAADLISGAACSSTLQGIVLEQLTADARLTAAVAAAQRGTVVCPGLAAGVDATTLTFPETLAPPASAQVVLGCSRDCLYLVTLVRADGTPSSRSAVRCAEARPQRPSRCRGRR